MKSGFVALSLMALTSTATALCTPGVARMLATCSSVTVLVRTSDADFCATMKSAFPSDSTSAAEVWRLCVTTLRVTTAVTAMATATAVSAVRNRRVPRLCRTRPTKVIGPSFPAGRSSTLSV